MIEVLDILIEEFPQIVISDEDKNGKRYKNTRWFFPKDKERYHNVFIEVWEHPMKRVVDVVIYRELLTPAENEMAELDGNDRINSQRGKLRLYNIERNELLNFIKKKIEIYCNHSNQ